MHSKKEQQHARKLHTMCMYETLVFADTSLCGIIILEEGFGEGLTIKRGGGVMCVRLLIWGINLAMVKFETS
jgi:hypothetical protein